MTLLILLALQRSLPAADGGPLARRLALVGRAA